MEDVLDVYTQPRDPDVPLVCLDETSKQLISETRTPIPMKTGSPKRIDYEYERKGERLSLTVKVREKAQPIPAFAGTCLFMMFAPLEGWRHVDVTERRTAIDYAQVLKDLSDIHFPNAKKIVLVQDNLNTHTKASLYEAFPAPEARRLARSASSSTTRPSTAAGSIPACAGTGMAESELGVLSSQCLDRRIPDKETLIKEVAVWQADRNTNHTKANWRFTTADARIKLNRLYPQFE